MQLFPLSWASVLLSDPNMLSELRIQTPPVYVPALGKETTFHTHKKQQLNFWLFYL
jgi:hypothetical protein